MSRFYRGYAVNEGCAECQLLVEQLRERDDRLNELEDAGLELIGHLQDGHAARHRFCAAVDRAREAQNETPAAKVEGGE